LPPKATRVIQARDLTERVLLQIGELQARNVVSFVNPSAPSRGEVDCTVLAVDLGFVVLKVATPTPAAEPEPVFEDMPRLFISRDIRQYLHSLPTPVVESTEPESTEPEPAPVEEEEEEAGVAAQPDDILDAVTEEDEESVVAQVEGTKYLRDDLMDRSLYSNGDLKAILRDDLGYDDGLHSMNKAELADKILELSEAT